MGKFLKTVPDETRHSHVIYVNDNGQGRTSIDKKHAHSINADAESQSIVIEEVNKHTHTPMEMPVRTLNFKEKEVDVVADIKSLRQNSVEWESDSRDRQKKSEEFYSGEGQWNKRMKKSLEGDSRAALTINKIEGKIDILSGLQRNNRFDIKFLPVEEGDAALADIINAVVKNITEQSDYPYEETDAFETCAIGGRGLLEGRIDYSKNIKGDIVLEEFPNEDIYFGEHIKKDMRDLEYYIKEKWYSFNKIKSLYPKKAKNIQREINLYTDDKKITDANNATDYDEGLGTQGTRVGISSDSFVNKFKKEFKITECTRKHYDKKPIIINEEEPFESGDNVLNGFGFELKDIEAIKTIPGIRVIEIEKISIRRTKIAGSILLSDNTDYDFDDLPIFPIYAKKRGKNYWGKISPVMDSQKEINKRHSQITDFLNKLINGGWFYDSNTFYGPADEKNFKEQASQPGFLAKLKNMKNKPERAEIGRFPSELFNVIALENNEIREIMNVNLELGGLSAGANQSGVAIVEKKKNQLIGNEFLFDNLSRTKKRIGRWLLRAIKKVYTPERILRIIQSQNAMSPVEIGGQPFDNSQNEAIMKIFEDSDVINLDVIVSESAYSASNRQSNFFMWMDAAARGLQGIPPDMLVALSDLPDKEKWIGRIMETIQAAAQAEQDKLNTELQKTQIAAQSKQELQ